MTTAPFGAVSLRHLLEMEYPHFSDDLNAYVC
jgi:hypothetical protein